MCLVDTPSSAKSPALDNSGTSHFIELVPFHSRKGAVTLLRREYYAYRYALVKSRCSLSSGADH